MAYVPLAVLIQKKIAETGGQPLTVLEPSMMNREIGAAKAETGTTRCAGTPKIFRLYLGGDSVPEIVLKTGLTIYTVRYRLNKYRVPGGWVVDMPRVNRLLEKYPEA